MATRKPLVRISGRNKEIPSGDTLPRAALQEVVADAIAAGVTDVAPSQGAVHAALGEKADSAGLTCTSGYFSIESFSASYGEGTLQSFYDANNGRWNVQGRGTDNSIRMIELAINGTITEAGSRVWTAATFNPANKFDVAGGNITGDVKIGTTANGFSGTARTLSVSAGQSGEASVGMNMEGSRTGTGQLFARFAFWHQGVLVASFNSIRGAADEGSFAIASKATGGGLAFRWEVSSTGHFLPWADNAYDHGAASKRSRELFCANSTINTSDAREKSAPRDLKPEELAAAEAIARLPSIFQWLHAIEAKGADDARLHCSPTVQAVMAILQAHGLEPFRYAFICYDQWDETPEVVESWPAELDKDGNVLHEAGSMVTQPYVPAGDRYSLRPSELEAFCRRGLAWAQQRDHQAVLDELATIKSRLAALEA